MRWITVIAFSFSLATLGMSQELDISGYLEPQLAGFELNDEFVHLGTNKLRLDLASSLSEKVTFAADLVYLDYYGRASWDARDFIPRRAARGLPPLAMEFEDEFYLDNAFLKLATKRADLVLGKQQISPGTGYAWNPTDLFNRKDVYDPTYEQRGHSAARFDLPLGNRSTLIGLYAPGDSWELSGKMLRLKSGAGHFDLSLVLAEKGWPYMDYAGAIAEALALAETTGVSIEELADGVDLDMETPEEKRRLYGVDLAGELVLGCWAEYAWNEMAGAEFWELAAGLDYTLESGLYIMGEFLHKSDAPNDSGDYGLNDWLRSLGGETLALSRNQAYLYLNYPWGELTTLGLSGIYSVSDESVALVPQMNYSPYQDVELTLYANAGLGKAGTAYSSKLGKGGVVRLRVYF